MDVVATASPAKLALNKLVGLLLMEEARDVGVVSNAPPLTDSVLDIDIV